MVLNSNQVLVSKVRKICYSLNSVEPFFFVSSNDHQINNHQITRDSEG